MKTTAEKIAVMQAYERGEKIEIKMGRREESWESWTAGEPNWNWPYNDYRVAPKPIECWVVVEKDGINPMVFESELIASTWRDQYDETYSGRSPHRVVHMREVTP